MASNLRAMASNQLVLELALPARSWAVMSNPTVTHCVLQAHFVASDPSLASMALLETVRDENGLVAAVSELHFLYYSRDGHWARQERLTSMKTLSNLEQPLRVSLRFCVRVLALYELCTARESANCC